MSVPAVQAARWRVMWKRADRFAALTGDCRKVLAGWFPDESVDAVVCDPPYGLEFMGKDWDYGVPGVEFWQEIGRTMKPGAHLVAFGGTRTFHRLAVAIEDAGLEIRDCLMWLYGTGFPKSLDVSKAIDKAGGESPARQAAALKAARIRAGMSHADVAAVVGCTPSSVRDWEEGRARAVGAPIEFVTPSPEYRQRLADLLGYTADERRIVGVGGGKRRLYDTGHRGIAYDPVPATPKAKRWQGWGTALKPAWEPIILARKPLAGTVAANVLEHGTGALNIDGTRIGIGRWPANVVLDEAAAALLDEQSGESRSRRGLPRRSAKPGDGWGMTATGAEYDDSGGASRFFYVAKASKAERNANVPSGRNDHPTVKPVALMRWLVRLVTPPGGVVLDPFMGSGSTGVAALREGFRFVGVDMDEHYVNDLAIPRLLAEQDQAEQDQGASA